MYLDQILSSVAHPDWLKGFIEANYKLSLISCIFFLRSQNDTYLLRLDNGTQYVARLSRPKQGTHELKFELDILDFLSKQSELVRVPKIIKTSKGADFIDIPFPEGMRGLVLFEFLEGEPLIWHKQSARFYGEKLGALHLALDKFPLSKAAYHYDSDEMIHKPLVHIKEFCKANPCYQRVNSQMTEVVPSLTRAFANIQPTASYGLIHWDHFHNCMQLDDETVVFFDFDSSGYGARQSDLAMVDWAFKFFNPEWGIELQDTEENLFYAFLEGYHKINPITQDKIDEQIGIHALCRIYWDMGLHAKFTKAFGSFSGNFMNDDYFDHRLTILTNLADQYL